MGVFTGCSQLDLEDRFSDGDWYNRFIVLNVTEIPKIGKGDGKSDSKRM